MLMDLQNPLIISVLCISKPLYIREQTLNQESINFDFFSRIYLFLLFHFVPLFVTKQIESMNLVTVTLGKDIYRKFFIIRVYQMLLVNLISLRIWIKNYRTFEKFYIEKSINSVKYLMDSTEIFEKSPYIYKWLYL